MFKLLTGALAVLVTAGSAEAVLTDDVFLVESALRNITQGSHFKCSKYQRKIFR